MSDAAPSVRLTAVAVERLNISELDAAVDARRRAVEAYGLTWWIDEAGAQRRVSPVPGLRQALTDRLLAGVEVQTSDVYRQGASWAEPRPALHKILLAGVLPAVRPQPTPGTPAFILFGAPGSGKTSTLRPRLLKADARTGRDPSLPLLALDADEIRVRFPEYADGLGSLVVQNETSYVTYGTLRRLALGGAPWAGGLCIDVVGDPAHAAEDVRALDGHGYRVHVLLATCPTEERLVRIERRALTSGRYVSLEFAASVGDRPLRAYEAAKLEAQRLGVLDGWLHMDTSGASPDSSGLMEAGGSLSP